VATRFVATRAISTVAWDPGAPVRSAPRILKNHPESWRVGALAASPRAALVVLRPLGSPLRESWLVAPRSCASTSEAALHALVEGVQYIRNRGAKHVTFVVFDATLAGYCWGGWQPRSLRMHRALETLLEAAGALELHFENRSRKAHRIKETGT
jgi:hypothetical protein